MIFFILFPFLSFSNTVSLKGNWKDSYLKDEAIVFFEKNEPSLVDKVKSALKDVDEDDQLQILNSLSSFVQQPLFGLLNLSLSLRFYQPAASIKSTKKGNPTLHGWVLEENIGKNLQNLQNIHFSAISTLKNYKSPLEKLHFLKNSSFSIESLLNLKNRNSQITSAKQIVNKYPQWYTHSSINGRTVKFHYYDVLDGLIEEYRATKLFSFSKSLFNNNGYREPHYFTSQPSYMQVLMPHNIAKMSEGWPEKPNIKSNDYTSVLKSRRTVVVTNIFFDLTSPESPALLNWAIEHILKSSPLLFNVTLNFDPKNKTQKHIAYAWHQSVDTLGVRNAVIFMVDGFKRNNFKRAYKATLPTLSWKGLKDNMDSSHKHTRRINQELDYCRKKNISVGVALNGEFIQERPIFPIIESKFYACITRLKKAINDGETNDFTNVMKWASDNAIHMRTSKYPIEITFNNYITIHGFSDQVINSTVTKIISLAKSEKKIKYPVVTFNSKNKKSKFDVDISEFSEEEIQLLKVNKNDVFTIVGPLVFQGVILTDEQITFAQDYTDYVFITNNLESNLTSEQLLLSLFFRSTHALDGVKRQSIKQNLPDSLKIKLKTNSSLTWKIVEDPFTYQGAIILDMAIHAFESGAASIIFYPNVNHNEYNQIPFHFNYHFYSAFKQDEINFKNNLYFVGKSPYLSVIKKLPDLNNPNKVEFTCTSIITHSLLFPKGERIKISDSLITPTNDIGFFSPILGPGCFEAEGLSSKSYKSDKSFCVDSFVPHLRFYFSNGEKITKTTKPTTYLNIVVQPENDSKIIKNEIKVLLYTILNNTKEPKKIRLYIASTFPFDELKDIETIVIPSNLPHFYNMRLANRRQLHEGWKFILSDIYLPNDQKYLFLDTRMIFTGDASRFLRLDMNEDEAVAAPVMTDNWFNKRKMIWNTRKYLMMRYKKPYHTSSLIWMDMNKWTMKHIGDRFRMLLAVNIDGNCKDDKISEVIFNSIQLYIQFITLPEEVAFNSDRSSARLAKKALSIELVSKDATRFAKVKLEKVKQKAFEYFN